MISADTSRAEGGLVKLIVFDMGHVFVDFEWEQVCLGFCQRAGCTLEALRAVFNEVSKLGYESGRIGTEAFLKELNTRLGTDIQRDEFTKIWMTSFRENEHMAELMGKLRQQSPLYLLSNTNEVQFEWLESNYQVTRHFDEVILSYRVGWSKPEKEIYEEVMRRSGIAAEHCLFIDDLECNIAAASALGMQTIRFLGVTDLRERLHAFGLTI